ncbi:MAG TPA: DedA family protein [Candidatus Aenigmarchaeota archaeon]|nr:DedA family protein [Candidatus Aenigmarchaeota archaeon]
MAGNFISFGLALVQAAGYAGIFLVSMIGSASILLPVPTDMILFLSSAILNPLLVGTIAAVGSAIGELTGYYAGYLGRKILRKNDEAKFDRIIKKYGFLAIVIFSFTPLPMDIMGIAAGGVKYSVRKFFIAVLIGKLPRSLMIAFAGFYGIPQIMAWLGSG